MKVGAVVIAVLNYSKQLKATFVWCMSIQTVDYILCLRCAYWLIGKIEKYLCAGRFETVSVFKVTINWVCLNYCHIESERIAIRKIKDN